MEDGPEAAEGNYPYNDRIYRLVEVESEIWQVFDSEVYLGQIVALRGSQESGPEYTIDFPGEENHTDEFDAEPTDDWRRALETLIDRSVTPDVF